MAISAINHFNIRAEREVLETLLNFYATVLGLKVGYRPPFKSFGYWLYADEKDVLHLTEASADEKVRGAGGIDHVAFSCFNVEEFKMRLKLHDIDFSCEHVPTTNEYQIFINDPVGNGIELNFSSKDH